MTKVFALTSLALFIALLYTLFFITPDRQARVYNSHDTMIALHQLENR